ncbi:MAG: Protein often found in Actinomycetes clustered with signal peptidase and/or RNaseHII [Thermoleophilia bacterium]|nr:Protein often found in Actinomycetes clustered with signal peptidase and/or RNaseHII [Thermoleophilia bacterium]
MANTDDLDEYDAELELRLKKEYADVFQIFKYCVITDEATYLCNELAVDCVPHAAYLLFELDMQDVWVWDRNRPTRIIPRAHVFTTGDVTVEQLKGTEAELEAALPSNVLEQLRVQLAIDADADDDSEGSDDESEASNGGAEEAPPEGHGSASDAGSDTDS